jgi:hypothetical protein
MFYEKLVKSLPTFGDKLRGVKIARDIEREISRYLLTFTLINAALGVAIALAMYAAGLPNPALWGVMAALFNYVPYVGAFTGLSLVTLVSIVSFDSLSQAAWPPFVYATIILIEGQFLSPFLVGRRLELNVVAVFLAVVFWTWVWGVIGAFIAVPMLVTVKVFADHVDGPGALGEFLPPATCRRPRTRTRNNRSGRHSDRCAAKKRRTLAFSLKFRLIAPQFHPWQTCVRRPISLLRDATSRMEGLAGEPRHLPAALGLVARHPPGARHRGHHRFRGLVFRGKQQHATGRPRPSGRDRRHCQGGPRRHAGHPVRHRHGTAAGNRHRAPQVTALFSIDFTEARW